MTAAGSTGSIRLSIVVPAYNEASRITRSFPEIVRYADSLAVPYEIIVVDDGSTDRTAEVVLQMASGDPRVRVITLESNSGKGRAVRTGMLAAAGDCVIFTDADLSTPISTISPFMKHLADGFDVVVGNRRMKESILEVRQPKLREFLGRVFTRLTLLVLRSKVTDQTCGFKGFTRRAASEIFKRQLISDWAFDAEILHIADRLRLKIRQHPVVWRDDAATKVKVAGACLNSLKSLAVIWWNGISGKYR